MTTETRAQSRTIVAHPYFWGLFPLFSLLSTNLVWAAFGEVILPGAVVLVIALAASVLLRPILPQPHKRGLVVSLLWIPFFGFGATVDALRAWLGFRDMIGPGALGLLAFVAGAAVLGMIYLLRRSPRAFGGATRALNLVSSLALCVALASCALAAARQRPARVESAVAGDVAVADPGLPNIYFILCDAYPRADYLQSYFDFDNTGFLSGLTQRGFYIASRSRSNYPNTLPSLAATFNMAYLDSAIAPDGWDKHYPALLPQVRDNGVVRFLKARGYEFVAIASGLFPTELEGADRFIRPGESSYTEYQQRLIDMTPIRSVLNRMKKSRWHHRAPFVLDTLVGLRRQDRPMFVFAHLLAPHLPHAYDAEGNVRESFPPYKEGWRQVTSFLNKRLLDVVDAIQAHEPNSVVLILSDHGPNTSWQDAIKLTRLPWEGTWEDYVRDRTANLFTCYFPDRQYEGLLYPEITPVNAFRIIFNRYFNTDHELLEDVTYLSPQNSTEIVRVTEVY